MAAGRPKKDDHIWTVIKPTKRVRATPPKLWHPSIFTEGPSSLRGSGPDPNQPPDGWPGSRPEWMVYQELISQGKSPQGDFNYQTSLMGGRQEFGGIVADFVVYSPPIVINVQGGYWHFDMGVSKQSIDEIQRAEMTSLGYTVVYIDESDIEADVNYFVAEALAGHDHSTGAH